jgi:trans-aconitate 2-methyltransferase
VSATSWDPDQYQRYRAYRDRPALDLMVQLPGDLEPANIWDLGCGTGEHAAVLAARHPNCTVHGLDSSPAMLERARATRARVTWVQGDIATFAPPVPPDLIFTNAALQWVPDHAALFPRLAGMLAPGGVFACQMPLSFGEPWHTVLRDVAASGPWAPRLRDVRGVLPVLSVADYYRLLSPDCATDIWTTTYLHELTGDDPVLEWMKGTGLRPYLDRLTDGAERADFLAAYAAALRPLFPVQADGVTLFPFPRLFVLARRG